MLIFCIIDLLSQPVICKIHEGATQHGHKYMQIQCGQACVIWVRFKHISAIRLEHSLSLTPRVKHTHLWHWTFMDIQISMHTSPMNMWSTVSRCSCSFEKHALLHNCGTMEGNTSQRTSVNVPLLIQKSTLWLQDGHSTWGTNAVCVIKWPI